MFYEAYQIHNDVLGPVRLMAETVRCVLNQPWPWFANAPLIRSASAAMELLSNAGMSHARPDFGIRTVLIEGQEVAVTEEIAASDPFCNLLHFRKDKPCEAPRILVVAPLSGHFATLLRGTVEALLPEHDVYITDWADARDVPLSQGNFDLDDYIDYVIEFCRYLGPDVHVIAVCQPSVPVLAAASLMAQAGDPRQPRSLTLMGGPIDTRESPTTPNDLA